MILQHMKILVYCLRRYYITGCLLDYPYFKENYKLIAIDLSKQQALNADPRVIQKINFTTNLIEQEIQPCFSLLKKQKKLFKSNCKSLANVV